MRRLRQKGFTLTEMLLVTAVMVILMAIGAPLYASLNNNNQLDAAVSVLAQDLYQAQTYSRNQAQDSQWGVAANGQTITLFSGASYATRNTSQDVVYAVPSSVALSGTGEIVYSKLYGLPQSAASFSLVSNSKTGNVVVNNKGMVEY